MIIITILKGKMMTAKRFILNETSYHGQGAAAAIIDEIKSRGFNKALIVTDADLIKFGVVKKITDLLEAEASPMPCSTASRPIPASASSKPAWKHSRRQEPTI